MAELAPEISGRVRRLRRADAADGARRRNRRDHARHQRTRRLRHADLHQCRGQAARLAGIPSVLRGDGKARQADLGASLARRNFPDYQTEKKSLYEIWWTFGWAYETAAMMSRLVFSKILDDMPKLKVIVHHFGSIVPTLEGRVGPGWDQLGARTSDEDYGALLEEPEEAPDRLFQARLLPGHRDLHLRRRDEARLRLLRLRQGDLRVRLPVRSGKGHDVYPRDAAHSRQLRNAEGRSRQGLLPEPGTDHGQDVRQTWARAKRANRIQAKAGPDRCPAPLAFGCLPSMAAVRYASSAPMRRRPKSRSSRSGRLPTPAA